MFCSNFFFFCGRPLLRPHGSRSFPCGQSDYCDGSLQCLGEGYDNIMSYHICLYAIIMSLVFVYGIVSS